MTNMKKKIIIAFLSVFIVSCEGVNESPYCHTGIVIKNKSNIPICVYQVDGYRTYDIHYAMGSLTEKSSINSGDSSFANISGWQDCLEDEIEWAQTHSYRSASPDLRTIYICDTNKPSVIFYSTPDSVLIHYNILKVINLLDSNLTNLSKRNFVVQYP